MTELAEGKTLSKELSFSNLNITLFLAAYWRASRISEELRVL